MVKLRVTREPAATDHPPAPSVVPTAEQFTATARTSAQVTATQSASTTGRITTPTSTAVTDGPMEFGFNDIAVLLGRLTGPQAAAHTADAGGTIYRVGFDWQYAEKTKDVVNWGPYDHIYDSMKARGIKVLWIPFSAPRRTWPSAFQCPTLPARTCYLFPAARYDKEWQQVLKQLTARYPDSAGIEVWNEPNLKLYSASGVDPARYASLLSQAWSAIKSVNPSMQVISGGLSNTSWTNTEAMAVWKFLPAMFAAGAKGKMDSVGVHPYPGGTSLDWMGTIMKATRDAMTAAGEQPSKRISVTEMGMSTTGTKEQYAGFTEQEQADTMMWSWRVLAWMNESDMMVAHTIFDLADEPWNSEAGYGFHRFDGTRKPVFCVMAAELGKPCADAVALP